MAGRVSKLSTYHLSIYQTEMEAKAKAEAEAARYRRAYSGQVASSFWGGRNRSSFIGAPNAYGRYADVVAALSTANADDGFCYTAMAAGAEAMRNMQSLGPSPTVRELLSAPLEWFSYPLTGTVTAVGGKSCYVQCEAGLGGESADRFFTLAATKRNSWPRGSLGEELIGGHLGKSLLVGSGPVSSPCGDVVHLKNLPEVLPAGVLVVCGDVGAIPGLQDRYPSCRIVEPEEGLVSKDAVYLADSFPRLDDSAALQLCAGVSRTFVWVSRIELPPLFLRQRPYVYAFGEDTPLEKVVVGPDKPVRSQRVTVDDDYVDDQDYLFLCDHEELKAVLIEWFPEAVANVRTVAEAAGNVVADVYLFTTEALLQKCACPQMVTRDLSKDVDLQEVGATRGFYLISSPTG